MLAAVNFNNQSRLDANEIGNVWRYRVLTPELETAELAISQGSPKSPFCVSLIVSQYSCSTVHASLTLSLSQVERGLRFITLTS